MSEDLILLYAFADLHGISCKEARRRWQRGMITGTKRGPGRQAAIVLNARGMHDFYVQFHETPGWRSCDQCPHNM
jgi:hypothetical protein